MIRTRTKIVFMNIQDMFDYKKKKNDTKKSRIKRIPKQNQLDFH